MTYRIACFSLKAHFISMAQAFIKSHASYAEKVIGKRNEIPLNPYLTMVTKTKGEFRLTNPYFQIEDCVEPLYILNRK